MSILYALLVGLCAVCDAAYLRKHALKVRHSQIAQTDHATKVMMVWTPRAACSTAMEVWAEHIGRYRQAIARFRFIHDWREQVLNHMADGAQATSPDWEDARLFKFKVVMNPFHRAVTMYEHALHTRWYGKPCGEASTQALRGAALPLGLYNLTFVEFLRFQRDAQHNILMCGAMGFHLAMQTGMHKGKIWRPDYVCRIEEFETCLAAVSRATGIEWKAPPQNSSVSARHNTERQDMQGEVASIGYRQFATSANSENYYNGESGAVAAELVRELYAPDFHYGYDRARPQQFDAFAEINLQEQMKMKTEPLQPDEIAAAENYTGEIWKD